MVLEEENIELENPFSGFDLTSLDSMSEMLSTGMDVEEEVIEEETEQTEFFETGEEEINEDTDGNDAEVDDDVPDEDDDEDKPSSQNTKGSESALAPYAKLLVEEGILQEADLENFDGTVEGLIQAQLTQFQRWQEEYKASLDPRVKWLQDRIEDGVSLEALLALDKTKTDLSKITSIELEDNEDLQKQIAREYYKRTTTNWSEARIEKEINRLNDLGELGTEAKEFYSELQGILQQEEQQLQQQAIAQKEQLAKQQEETLNTFKQKLESINEIVPGLPVSKLQKDKIFKTLTTPVAYDNYGNALNAIAKAKLENPMEFEINLAHIWDITKGFKDWSILSSTGKKKAIQEFEQAAERLNAKTGGKPQVERAHNKQTTNKIIEGMKAFMK